MIDVRQAGLIAGAALLAAGAILALRPAPTPPAIVPILPPVAPVPERLVGQAVAVAARDIPRGGAIEAGSIAFVTMERPPGPGTSATAEPLLGHVAVERIAAGQTILAGMLSAARTDAGLAPLVPLQTRAVTLRVADDTGVAYLIRPGDRVDVMVTTRSGGEGATRAELPDLARLVVQDLPVLAVGDMLGAEPQLANAPRREAQRTVTLAATPEQLLTLGLTRADGGYMLALRNPEDREGIQMAPVMRSTLLGASPPPRPVTVNRPAPAPAPAPRPARTGPEIIRGPAGGNRS